MRAFKKVGGARYRWSVVDRYTYFGRCSSSSPSSAKSSSVFRGSRTPPSESTCVRSLLTTDTARGALCVSSRTSVAEAARVMCVSRGYSVAVVSERDELIGILTERDILQRVFLNGNSLDVPVSKIMTEDPECLSLDHSLDDVIDLMLRINARNVPVVAMHSDDLILRDIQTKVIPGQLIGVISAFQVMERLAQLQKYLVQGSASVEKILKAQRLHGQSRGYDSPWPLVAMPESNTVSQAVVEMASNNVGAVVSLGDDGQPSGLFTETDLLRSSITNSEEMNSVPLSEHMTRDVDFAQSSDSLVHCLSLMVEKRYRHLPVFEVKHKKCSCIGILSVKDFLRSIYGG
eukprot:721668_1